MPRTVRDVMSPDPIRLASSTSVQEAARAMRERDIGDVVVVEGGELVGIVTDRDIVVRAVALGLDAGTTPIRDVCSRDPVTVGPDDDVSRAEALMADEAVRRLPVVDGGRVVGIVSIGDLAVAREPGSTLGEISAAPPDSEPPTEGVR